MPDDALCPQPEQFFAVLRMRRKLQEVVEPLGFGPYEAAILFQVNSGMTDRRNHAEPLALQESAVSALVAGLVQRGMLTKTKDETDSRRMSLQLTATGADAVTALRKAWDKQGQPDVESLQKS